MLGISRPRIILMIGDDGIVTVPHGIADAAPFFTPASDRHAPRDIGAVIDRHPKARITLMADTLAQDYRADDLPRLFFLDRARLIRRRLKQHYPAAALTACLRQGATGKFLMIGLHEANPVLAWAQRLRARLPDIALLPVEGARLLQRLSPHSADGWAMLVSRQMSGGYRQIVTCRGQLVFTRLTPLADAADECSIIVRDIKASLDYLIRHGLRDAGELGVLLLLPGNPDRDAAFAALRLGSVSALSPHAAARRLGLPFAPDEDESASDLLFAAAIANRRPAPRLMLPDARRQWRVGLIRRAGTVVASLLLLIAVARAGIDAGGLLTTLAQARAASALLDKTQHEFDDLRATAAPVTEPLGRLRQAIERRRIYAAETPTPWHDLTRLSTIPIDGANIVKLQWSKDSDNAPDIFSIGLRVNPPATDSAPDSESGDRAATVAAFARAAQAIGRGLPDYTVLSTTPPYPALPQESVTAQDQRPSDQTVGDIRLQKNMTRSAP